MTLVHLVVELREVGYILRVRLQDIGCLQNLHAVFVHARDLILEEDSVHACSLIVRAHGDKQEVEDLNMLGLECFEDGDGLKVNKEIDGGYEVIGIKCPCLVTFTMPSFECRYPTIKRKLMANKAKFETLFEELGDDFDPTMDAAHYGLNGSPTHVKRSFTPPVKEGGMKIKEETGEDSAKVLAKILVDKGIV